VAARLDTPVLGVQDSYTGPNRWQVSMNYRYQYSHRHFVGPDEQKNRADDHSQVKNNIHLMEVGLRYNPNPQWSFSLNIPYFDATRSSPVRDSNRVVVDRSVVQASGLSDITLSARRLLWKPLKHPDGNLAIGLGVKIPTGEDDVFDDRKRLVNGQTVFTEESVDQSIQPGDGGWGFALEATGFRRFGGRSVGYASASYLFNPEEQSKTDRGGNDPNTRFLSIADQYLARVGAATNFRWVTASLGGRLEGVPSSDLLGGDKGFRRPGYAISVEPGLTFRRGHSALTVGVPVAVYRNRTRSYADKINGGHGDAAFADYILLLGFTRLF
jgi:hypothetical protein